MLGTRFHRAQLDLYLEAVGPLVVDGDAALGDPVGAEVVEVTPPFLHRFPVRRRVVDAAGVVLNRVADMFVRDTQAAEHHRAEAARQTDRRRRAGSHLPLLHTCEVEVRPQVGGEQGVVVSGCVRVEVETLFRFHSGIRDRRGEPIRVRVDPIERGGVVVRRPGAPWGGAGPNGAATPEHRQASMGAEAHGQDPDAAPPTPCETSASSRPRRLSRPRASGARIAPSTVRFRFRSRRSPGSGRPRPRPAVRRSPSIRREGRPSRRGPTAGSPARSWRRPRSPASPSVGWRCAVPSPSASGMPISVSAAPTMEARGDRAVAAAGVSRRSRHRSRRAAAPGSGLERSRLIESRPAALRPTGLAASAKPSSVSRRSRVRTACRVEDRDRIGRLHAAAVRAISSSSSRS